MQGGSEWDGHCFEIRQASVFEGKGNNLMVIMLFGERHRKRAAGIAYRLASPYPLRLVDVTEGRIGQVLIKGFYRYRFKSSHDGPFAPVIFRQFSTSRMQVSHRKQGLARLPLAVGIIIELAIHSGNALHIGIFPFFRSGIISLTKIGNSQTDRFPFSFLII